MYKLCKTEQSAVRQRELEKGLLKFMQTVRYEDISVSDLCQSLQIPRKSFYRYFNSKDGALYALLDHTLMEFSGFSAEYERQGAQSVHHVLESLFRFWMVHRELLDALSRSGITGLLIERAIAYALTEDILPSQYISDDAPDMKRRITMFAVCGLMSMVITWHHEGFLQPAPEMAVIALRMLKEPLFSTSK